jgi:hypothetical protein
VKPFFVAAPAQGDIHRSVSGATAFAATAVHDGRGSAAASASSRPAPSPVPKPTHTSTPAAGGARIAVYDSLVAPPRVVDVPGGLADEFIDRLASTVYGLARDLGGSIPYTIVRELSENLIHADFAEVVVTIMEGGDTIRFSDQGPGVADKDRVFLPGFSTATADMKRFIRGVGSGLPIVRECVSFSGGGVTLEDNVGHGTVVTLRVVRPRHAPEPPAFSAIDSSETANTAGTLAPRDTSAPAQVTPSGSRPLFGAEFADSSATASDMLPATSPSIPIPASEPLSADQETEQAAETGPAAEPHLTTRQKRVLFLVMELGAAGPAAVARELAVALSTAYRDLETLEHEGLVVSNAGGKRTLTDAGITFLDGMFRS